MGIFTSSPQKVLKDWLTNEIPNKCLFEEEVELLVSFLPENFNYDLIKGSKFSQLKTQGNKFFQDASLQKARFYYEAASILAQSREEKSSINKNLAVTNFKQILSNCSEQKDLSLLKEGIIRMKEAVQFGLMIKNKPREWFTQLINTQNQALKFILNSILRQKDDTNIDKNQIISHLEKVGNQISLDIDFEIHLIIQKKIFDIIEEQIQELKLSEDYLKAESLHHRYLDGIKNLYIVSQRSKKERIRFFYKERYNDFEENKKEYQAYKLLQLGNSIYMQEQNYKIKQSSYKFYESEAIWEAVDAYKAAIKLYEGKYLNIEAECYFMLGQIYLEMFGNECQKVHHYIRNSISLDFNSSRVNRKQWYFEANHIMKILQKNTLDSEESLFDTWKSKNSSIIQKIVEQKNKGEIELIRWVIKEHLPSKQMDFKLKEKDFYNNKKLILKVMKLYHADKITNETQHFKNIAKFIIRNLTEFYEQYKSQSTITSSQGN